MPDWTIWSHAAMMGRGVITMKLAPGLFLLALCGSLTATAQVLPTSSGGCGVTASGTVSCDFLSAAPIKPGEGNTSKQTVCGGRSELIVTKINLAPGAPLTRWVPGEDELIIGMGAGQLVNEAKSPPLPISVNEGLVLLMPKEESYALRNIGKQELEVLVIRFHPISPASQ